MYFDIENKKNILLQEDSTSFEDWMRSEDRKFCCAMHPKGFMIFLEPGKIEDANEYKEGDPYGVSTNINSNFQRRRFRSTLKLLASIEPGTNLKILDLGCGEGHLTKAIIDCIPGCEVHGLDYSISAIETASHLYKQINFIVADGYAPPFVEAYFDVVVLNNIWEHVPDPLQMLSGVKRILKPGGAVIISTPSRYRFSNLVKALSGRRINFMSKLHVTEYSVGQVKEQLYFGGFQVKEVYSETIKENRLLFHWIKLLLRSVLKVLGSHHQLESTIFYLAEKRG